MAVLIIDTLSDGTPFYDQRVTLEDQEYLLRFRWNSRRKHWHLDVRTIAGEDIVLGQTIAIGTDLLRRSVSPNKPPGRLTALAEDDQIIAPELFDLGGRAFLYYFTSDDEALA